MNIKKALTSILCMLLLCACQQTAGTPVQNELPKTAEPQETAASKTIISSELVSIAPGKNAEAFLITGFPKELAESFSDPTLKEQLQKIKSLALVVKKDPLKPGLPVVWLGIVLTDEQTAKDTLSYIEKSNYLSLTTKAQFNLKQEGNMIISGDENKAQFTGQLSEHTEIIKLQKTEPQPVLFAYLDSQKIPELNFQMKSILSSLIEPLNNSNITTIANAASLTAKDVTITGKWENSRLTLSIRDNLFTDQTTLQNLLLSTLSGKTTPPSLQDKTLISATVNSAKQDYDNVLINELVDVKTFIENKNSISTDQITGLEFSRDQITLLFMLQPTSLEKVMGKINEWFIFAEYQAQNSIKQTLLSQILNAVEQYRIQNKKYPDNEGCMENILEIKAFLENKVIPKDPTGAQKFGDLTCKSGFFLQKKNNGYILWSKMEGENLGNTEWPDINTGTGNYLTIDMSTELTIQPDNSDNTSLIPSKPKVKRPSSIVKPAN